VDDLPAPERGGPEDSMVPDQVSSRRRNQRGEAAQQLGGLEQQSLAAIVEWPLQPIGDPPVGQLGKLEGGPRSRRDEPALGGRSRAGALRRGARSHRGKPQAFLSASSLVPPSPASSRLPVARHRAHRAVSPRPSLMQAKGAATARDAPPSGGAPPPPPHPRAVRARRSAPSRSRARKPRRG